MTDLTTFEIYEPLGKGGFGEVYRVRMTTIDGLSRIMALKVLHGHIGPKSQAIERLRYEGRILAQLRHPAILRVDRITSIEQRIALVLEYVDGEDLSGCCRGEDALTERGLVYTVGEVASALHKGWAMPGTKGVPLRLVHRDIKPSNIRLGKDGEVKLLDFGIAKSDAMTREALTATDTLIGSMPYLAPERFLDRPVGPEADIFGLGCCLFEGLTGERLFRQVTGIQAFALAYDNAKYERFIEQRLAIIEVTTPELLNLLVACVAYEPLDRPSAAELAERCDALTEILPGASLKAWAWARNWGTPVASRGPLSGRTVSSEVEMEGVIADVSAVAPSHTQAEEFVTADVAIPQGGEPEQRASTTTNTTVRRVASPALITVMLGGLLVVTVAGVSVWFKNEGQPETQATTLAEAEPVRNAQPISRTSGDAEIGPIGETVPIRPHMPVPTQVEKPEPLGSIVAKANPPTVIEVTPPAVELEPGENGSIAGVDAALPKEALLPANSPAMPGIVTITGEQRAVLRRNGVDHPPGELPEGDYVVFVNFGDGLQESVHITVKKGLHIQLKCNKLYGGCSIISG